LYLSKEGWLFVDLDFFWVFIFGSRRGGELRCEANEGWVSLELRTEVEYATDDERKKYVSP
jgi:hypothetical protein